MLDQRIVSFLIISLISALANLLISTQIRIVQNITTYDSPPLKSKRGVLNILDKSQGHMIKIIQNDNNKRFIDSCLCTFAA